MNKILITGAAGFIGFHLSKKLMEMGYEVIGVDNLNTYYDVQLKLDRLSELGIDTRSQGFTQQEKVRSSKYSNFQFQQLDLCNEDELEILFRSEHFNIVIHLAAQAGVRYSLKNPKAYIQSNIVGFANLLEACRHHKIAHFVFASSSSVYGNQQKTPFEETDPVDHPISLYAATKKSNELMAYTYAHLYGIPTTGLRFFTVYGPWGRPDMAPFLFTKAILEEQPIKVFNHGNLMRDFTYIDDIVNGVIAVIEKGVNKGDYEIYNIGNNLPEKLMDFITILEKHIGKEAIKEYLPMQNGDVFQTYASIDRLNNKTNYRPTTNLEEGLKKFIAWYMSYYKADKQNQFQSRKY